METAYFFGEHIRWSFGLGNPNAAGAVIAILIAFLLPFSSTLPLRRWLSVLLFTVFLVAELSLWFYLAKTYSRGALVAVIVCFIVSNAVLFFFRCLKGKDAILLFSKVACIAIIIFSVGLSARVSPGFLRNDGSTTARITLWQGGLKMIAASPINGWGAGNSGKEYINWYQSIDDDRKYAGMVNSYLYIGVERGLPVLFVAVSAMLFCALLGLSTFASASFRLGITSAALGAALAILAFAIVNVFSTLWIYSILQWLLLATMGITLVLFAFRWNICSLAKVLLLSTTLAFLFCLALYLLGVSFLRKTPIEKTSNGVIFSGKPTTIPRALMLIDERSLGEYYGKTIREAAQSTDTSIRLINPDVSLLPAIIAQENVVIILGKQAKTLDMLDFNQRHVVLVNPIGSPPTGDIQTKGLKIYLGQFDVYNQHARWLRFAKTNDLEVVFLEATAEEVSPKALAQILSDSGAYIVD